MSNAPALSGSAPNAVITRNGSQIRNCFKRTRLPAGICIDLGDAGGYAEQRQQYANASTNRIRSLNYAHHVPCKMAVGPAIAQSQLIRPLDIAGHMKLG